MYVCGCDRYKYVNVSVFLCVRVFVVKTEGYDVTVLTSVYVGACMYARETKIRKERRVCLRETVTLRVIHQKAGDS